VINVGGTEVEQASLQEWLRAESELRGHVGVERGTPVHGKMGLPVELVVQVTATAVGASAVWTALAKSLTVWLTQRRSDVTVTITGASGRIVTVDAKRIPNAEDLVRLISDVAAED
jgi:Effector Associated Constant Component 1